MAKLILILKKSYFFGVMLVTVPIVEITKNCNLLGLRRPLFIEVNIALPLQFMQPVFLIALGDLLQSPFPFETIDDCIHFSPQPEVGVLERLKIRVVFDDLEH